MTMNMIEHVQNYTMSLILILVNSLIYSIYIGMIYLRYMKIQPPKKPNHLGLVTGGCEASFTSKNEGVGQEHPRSVDVHQILMRLFVDVSNFQMDFMVVTAYRYYRSLARTGWEV